MLHLEIKTLSETGEFEGYASVYGNKDYTGDVIEAGAFDATLAENANYPLLWQHNTDEPIGVITLMSDQHGLSAKGTLALAVGRAKEAYALLKIGALKGLSIGYRAMKDHWDQAEKVRRLLEVKLYEVSLVTFPANPLATVDMVKAGRVLSAANRQQIQGCIDILQSLLENSEPQSTDEDSKAEQEAALRSAAAEFRTALSEFCAQLH